MNTIRFCAATVLAALVAFAPAASAANIVILPGNGFDDTTPREPTDQNPGTTLGDQRSYALQYAAHLIGTKIKSDVDIRVRVEFSDQLDCTSTTAETGAAGPSASRANFAGAPQSDVFYPIALANALAGRDLAPRGNGDVPEYDIVARFNDRIDGNSDCDFPVDYYYGLEGAPSGGDIDFVSTAVHELIHGLGFITNVELANGEYRGGLPNAYDTLIRDFYYTLHSSHGLWTGLSANRRAASADNDPMVVLDGPASNSASGSLAAGRQFGRIRLYAPSVVNQGSSISHWTTAVSPNALMEPQDTGYNVNGGLGLAVCALADIGWELTDGVGCPDDQDTNPAAFNPDGSGVDNSRTNGITAGNTANSGSGGGGCSLAGRGGAIGPVLPLLMLAALAAVLRRRQSALTRRA